MAPPNGYPDGTLSSYQDQLSNIYASPLDPLWHHIETGINDHSQSFWKLVKFRKLSFL